LLGCQHERRGAMRRCERSSRPRSHISPEGGVGGARPTPVKSPCARPARNPPPQQPLSLQLPLDRTGCQGSGGTAGGGGRKGRDASNCVGSGDGCEAGLRSRLAAAEARAARAEACAAGAEARLEEAAAQLRWLEKQLDDTSGSGPSPQPHITAIASCAHLPIRREISRRRQLRPNQRPSALSWRRSGRDCLVRLRRSRRRPTESSIAPQPRPRLPPRLLRSNACPRHPSGRPRRRRRSTLHRRRGSLSIRRHMIMRRRQRQQ